MLMHHVATTQGRRKEIPSPQKHKSASLPTHSHPTTQILGNSRKLFQRRLQIFHNAGGKDIRGSQRISTFETFITQPEEVKAHLVAFEQFVIAKRVETLAFLPLVTVFRMVAGHEIIEMSAVERVGAERKVLVSAQVIDPQSLRPVIGAGRFLVEEECMYS